MLIVYDSLTGNVKRFMNKLRGYETKKITPNLIVNEAYILVTYTIGFGETPELTQDFLEWNHKHLIGVATSGNRIWGNNFTKSAITISKQYDVPIIHRFELSGTDKDVKIFTQEVDRIDKQYSKLD